MSLRHCNRSNRSRSLRNNSRRHSSLALNHFGKTLATHAVASVTRRDDGEQDRAPSSRNLVPETTADAETRRKVRENNGWVMLRGGLGLALAMQRRE